MSILYTVLDTLLPFEWASYAFMKNALLAMLLITPLFGVLGTMAVDNKMAFFSDALGHSALTGIAIGVVLGVSSQQASMLAFGIVWALLITRIKQRNTASADTVISVFSSTSIALGLVILARGGAFAKYSSYLVGDILAVTPQDLLYLAAPHQRERFACEQPGCSRTGGGVRVRRAGGGDGDALHSLGRHAADQLPPDPARSRFAQRSKKRGLVHPPFRDLRALRGRGRADRFVLPEYLGGRGGRAHLRRHLLRHPAAQKEIEKRKKKVQLYGWTQPVKKGRCTRPILIY